MKLCPSCNHISVPTNGECLSCGYIIDEVNPNWGTNIILTALVVVWIVWVCYTVTLIKW